MSRPPKTRSPDRRHLNPLSPSEKTGSNDDLPRPLPPNIAIAPITASTLPAYRRLITLLLPIRYPDKFYKDSVADPTPTSLALCALWSETPRPGKRKSDSLDDKLPPSSSAIDSPEAKVVGGIQCRVEPLSCPPPTIPSTTSATIPPPRQQSYKLYIQTLAVLSPYRHLGIATALLDAIISTVLTHYPLLGMNVKEIYAHVWEANEEALGWYVKRGFELGGDVVEGYYRKLRPSGARVVRRRVGVGDWVEAVGGWKADSGIMDRENKAGGKEGGGER